jgi:hypothetical protein
MMKLKFKADPRWFKHKAKEAIAIAEMSAVVGMKKAIERHKFDAINEPPTVPFKTGWLKDQHVTFVEVSKMIRFGDRYFGLISNTIISGLRRAGFR